MNQGRTRTSAIAAVALVILAAAFYSIRPITDSDFWHHIAFGRAVVESGAIPRVDTLSSTAAGRPWVSSGWLPSVVLYQAHRLNPGVGPAAGVVFPVAAALGLALLACGIWRTRNPALSALLVVAALGACFPRFLPRPDLFSQLMLPLLLVLLAWYDRLELARADGPNWRVRLPFALCPVLFLVWANLHMLFAIGLAVLGLYCALRIISRHTSRRARLMWVLLWVVSFAACFLTPYGWRAFWFILENARLNDTTGRINELKPLLSAIGEPGATASFVMLLLWAVAAAIVGWFGKVHRGALLWHWFTAAFLVILALLQRRQIALAVPGITVLLFAAFQVSVAATAHGQRRRRTVAAAEAGGVRRFTNSSYALLAPLVLFFGSGLYLVNAGALPNPRSAASASVAGIDCEWYPCEAIAFLESNPPPQRLFHDLYTGSFLAYHLSPATPVFIDGRLEVFNNGAYDDFFAPPEGRMSVIQLFEKYDVKSVLIDWRSAAQQPGHTAAILSADPNWQLCWFSDHYALFVKDDQAEGTGYIQRHGYAYLNPLAPEAFMRALENPQTAAAARAEARRAAEQDPGGSLARKAMEVSAGY